MSRHIAASAMAVTTGLALLATASPPSAYADDGRDRERVLRILSPQITESSSLFVGTVDPALVYTTNDSGDGPVVYAINTANGSLAGRTTIQGVDAVDIEALAGDQDGSLVVADIGDNDVVRDSVEIYRIPQPHAGDHVVSAEAVRLTYVDGPRDAESALYDATSGRVYIASKELAGASVYVTPPRVFDRPQAVLRPFSAAPPVATDATLLPSGDLAVIRTYGGATVYRFPAFEPVSSFGLPTLEQGESIAAPPGGRVVWAGTEGERSPVIAVRMPARLKGTPTPSPVAPASPTNAADPPAPVVDQRQVELRSLAYRVLVGSGAGLAAVLLLAIALALRRRHT